MVILLCPRENHGLLKRSTVLIIILFAFMRKTSIIHCLPQLLNFCRHPSTSRYYYNLSSRTTLRKNWYAGCCSNGIAVNANGLCGRHPQTHKPFDHLIFLWKKTMICPFYGKNEDYCDVGCGYISPHDVEIIIQFCSTRHHKECQTFQELMELHPEAAEEPAAPTTESWHK